jgi:tRNA (cmo5U34)-methyltransferase
MIVVASSDFERGEDSRTWSPDVREAVRIGAVDAFDVSGWSREEACRDYLDHGDIYIQDRSVLLGVARSFLARFLGDCRRARVLDLGCGDGTLGEALKDRNPSISLIAADGSADMIAAARRRLARWPDVEYEAISFDAVLRGATPWSALDLVASSFAIHHADGRERPALFRRIREMLAPGGYLLNVDILRPESPLHEAWYDELWREWIRARQERIAPGRDFSSVPEDARKKPENHYETLSNQLTGLREAGFVEVECHYRRGLFGVYSGRRPVDRGG